MLVEDEAESVSVEFLALLSDPPMSIMSPASVAQLRWSHLATATARLWAGLQPPRVKEVQVRL